MLSRMIRGSTGLAFHAGVSRTCLAGDEDRLLVRVVFHQVDAAQRFVVGGEADLAAAGSCRSPLEVVEDLLGVEVAPDRRAVVVGGVGVLAADDDVGEAEVLAVDGVHHRFLGAAVEHLDVQAQQDHAVGHRLAARAPELGIAVAFAQRAVVDQRLVGVHADVGVDVVALGLADQRVQAGPGVVPCAQQRLQAVDQGVLVGPVQRVAGLEGDHALPALVGQQLADLARREHVLAELGVLRLRQHLDLAAEQVRLVGVAHQHHVGAGVVGPLGQ